MKLTDGQYTLFCRILENRGYRYYDNEQDYISSDEFKTFKNIDKRVQGNKQGEVLRFNKSQKTFITELFEEYHCYNCTNESEDKKLIEEMLKQLTNTR